MALVSAPSKVAVPYEVDMGDSFPTLALKYYGLAAMAGPLALVNKKPLTDAPTIGDKLNFPPRLFQQTSRKSAQSDLQVGWLLHVAAQIDAACFAPGEEVWEDGDKAKVSRGDDCDIVYVVHDPCTKLTSAQLEVARKKEPSKVLAIIDLEPEQFTSGKHELKWDGKCTEGSLKGKYIHAVHSPYLVRVVAKTKERRVASNHPAEAVIRVKELIIERPPDLLSEPAPEPGTDAYYQEKLIELGYHCGPIDNDASNADTKRALKLFQFLHQGLSETGKLDRYTKAYLDASPPSGEGVDRYQFILNYIGYTCGKIDGLVGARLGFTLRVYCRDSGIESTTELNSAVRASLDGEVLVPLERRDVLLGDTTVDKVFENQWPAVGTASKLFVDCSNVLSPPDIPYKQKFAFESERLLRPRIPMIVRPLLESKAGQSVFSADATGPLPVCFNIDTAEPFSSGRRSPAQHRYVNEILTVDKNTTGFHAHEKRGGVRTDRGPGVFQALPPYRVTEPDVYNLCSVEAGPYLGTTGIYFCSSTIAGDSFTIIASLFRGGSMDTRPGVIQVKTGSMQVWRRYQISKRWFMGYVPRPDRVESVPQLGLAPWYKTACVEFLEPPPAKRILLGRNLAHPETVDLELYTSIVREAGYSEAMVSDAALKACYNDKQLFPLKVAAKYTPGRDRHYYWDIDIEIAAFEVRFGATLRELSYLESPKGIVLLMFAHNAPEAPKEGVDPQSGIVAFPGASPWSFSSMPTGSVIYLNYRQDKKDRSLAGKALAHEVGHTLWLHHATAKAAVPSPEDIDDHDSTEYRSCTMSYYNSNHFCGKCILKLRGFNEEKV